MDSTKRVADESHLVTSDPTGLVDLNTSWSWVDSDAVDLEAVMREVGISPDSVDSSLPDLADLDVVQLLDSAPNPDEPEPVTPTASHLPCVAPPAAEMPVKTLPQPGAPRTDTLPAPPQPVDDGFDFEEWLKTEQQPSSPGVVSSVGLHDPAALSPSLFAPPPPPQPPHRSHVRTSSPSVGHRRNQPQCSAPSGAIVVQSARSQIPFCGGISRATSRSSSSSSSSVTRQHQPASVLSTDMASHLGVHMPCATFLDLLEDANIVNLDDRRGKRGNDYSNTFSGPTQYSSGWQNDFVGEYYDYSATTGSTSSSNKKARLETSADSRQVFDSTQVSGLEFNRVPDWLPSLPVPVPVTKKASTKKPSTGGRRAARGGNAGGNGDRKPSTSYIEMVARALVSAPERKLLLGDIYTYITAHYPYYRTAPSTWKNAVRHNLTVNDCFVKLGRAGNGRGFYWGIHPACIDMFSSGDFRRMRARQLAQHMYKQTGTDFNDLSTVDSGEQAMPFGDITSTVNNELSYQQMAW